MTVVYDADVQVTMAGVVESELLPSTVHSLEIADGAARLEMRSGPKGPQGPQGPASFGFTLVGYVADQAALDAITVTAADKGKAWWVVATNEIRYWQGRYWIRFVDAMQGTGHQGPPNVLTGAAEVGPTGSSASATLTGTSPNQVLTITVPKGVTGAQGDPGVAGRIQDAADVDTTTVAGLSDRMTLQWDASLSKFVPAPNPSWGGPWTIGGNRFAAASNAAEAPRTIAVITVPAQAYPWRPYIIGRLPMRGHTQTVGGTRVDVEVRAGTEDGPIVAWSLGFPAQNWMWHRIVPRFEQVVSPAATNISVIQPGQTTTFYVRIIRPVGSGNYSTVSDIAFLQVYALPLFE
ncbi:hypothetical protein [Nocardia otitidiscaviarum]|uniref:hypothetical protein n=1 Tax=Nocardia otitidiscaviarum TaxID=1823 RepID=UPI0004A763EE|nr:hypothetical protein [Nocardia otitidiscaviarum]